MHVAQTRSRFARAETGRGIGGSRIHHTHGAFSRSINARARCAELLIVDQPPGELTRIVFARKVEAADGGVEPGRGLQSRVRRDLILESV